MAEESKLVIRQETFNDLAVREMAEARAACLCRIQFGRCKPKDCAQCKIHRQFMSCYNVMTDYDKLRLTNYIGSSYQKLSANTMAWRTHRSYLRSYLSFVFLMCLFIFLLIAIPLAIIKPEDNPFYYDYDEEIQATLKFVRENVYDIDKDYKVDCCDYAILFKVAWDMFYTEDRACCEIVRNYNRRTGMNHLFIAIRSGTVRIFVEPRAIDLDKYRMEDIWGYKFDPKVNSYGETSRWLSTIR